MQVELGKDYFTLFDLPATFEIDGESLALRFRDLQRAVHPDRFANASDQERRLSVQQAAFVNQAFQTLKNPLSRARYLLELKGVEFNDSDTSMDPAFLMEQMELRDALAAVRQSRHPFDALARTRETIEARDRFLIEELTAAFADGSTEALQRARDAVRKMQFLKKLLDEAEELEEELVHEA